MKKINKGPHLKNYDLNIDNGRLVIPEGVVIVDNLKKLCKYKKIETVEIPDSVITIDKNAFEKCKSLKNVKFGKNVTIIDEYAFFKCTSLTSIVIPDTVTVIGGGAFARCNSLNSVTIGVGIKRLEGGTFGLCTALNDIKFTGTMQQWKEIKKDAWWAFSANVSAVHCTDGDVEEDYSNFDSMPVEWSDIEES